MERYCWLIILKLTIVKEECTRVCVCVCGGGGGGGGGGGQNVKHD